MALNNLMAVIIRGQSGCRHLDHDSMLNIVSGIKWHYHTLQIDSGFTGGLQIRMDLYKRHVRRKWLHPA